MIILSLKNRFFKHKRKLLTLVAVSVFLVSMCTPVFLSSQPSTNTNYFQALLLNNLPNNNNINTKDSWLSGWNCRKTHTINGSTAGMQTNYQMRITVHYGSGTDSGENLYCNAHCRYDFGDVRFTNSDGTTLLDYWMENKTDGDKVTFWVEIDSIPASPSTVNIYIYYGKIDATTISNGDNTFIFFDDFLGISVNGTKWDQHNDSNGLISVSNGEIDFKVTSGTGHVAIQTNNSITQSKCLVETKAKGVYDGGSIDVQSPLLCMVNSPIDQSFSYSDENFFLGTDRIRHSWYTGSWNIEDYYVTTKPTTYKIFQIIKNGNVFIAKYLDLDYSEIASSNSRIVSDFSFYINMRTARPSECKYDWVRVRNYASPEPTHGAWGSQENVAALIFTHEFAGGNQYWDASAELDVELFLNLSNPVSLNMSRTFYSVGGVAPSGSAFIGGFVSIEANVSAPITGIAVTIHYTDREVAVLGLDENSLSIWYLDVISGNWTQLPSILNTRNNIVTGYTDHLTNFAILGGIMPPGALSPGLLLMLFLLLTSSGVNSLVYLVLGLVAVALVTVTVAVLGLREGREERVSEVRAPIRRARTQTPRRIRREERVSEVGAPTPTRYARARTPGRRRAAEVPEQEIVPEVRKAIPIPGKPHCIYCGHEVLENAKFCPVCGKVIARCSVCNQYIASEDRFLECPHCGSMSHRDHLLEWIKVKGRCPSCKKKLSQEELI